VLLSVTMVADGFDQPVLVTNAGDDRLFVVDQPGFIWVIDEDDPQLFLDVSAEVTFGGERGLLGMAFHPDYAVNGRFYVNYTDRADGTTKIVEYAVSADPNAADPASAREILSVDQPAGNHNGGMVLFGPDGNLWIGLGDGGASDDRFDNGQNPETLLGSMVRITVGPDIAGYEIPAGNTFAAPEVWAIGLRNPWRYAFDGDDLWIADVGQERVEEVDLVAATDTGLNFGWPIMEGSLCFRAGACDSTGLVLPIAEFTHPAGCSITGGFVYRGAAIPELAGHYFYSDYCSGLLRSITAEGVEHDWSGQLGELTGVTSFGVDAAGELYLTLQRGAVLKLEPGS
jgi:glucose/arabinose dehydrogenase